MRIVDLSEQFHEIKQITIYAIVIEADEEEVKNLKLGNCQIKQNG